MKTHGDGAAYIGLASSQQRRAVDAKATSRSQPDEAQRAMFGTPLLRLSTLVEHQLSGGPASIAATVFS
jgi:hypothetical protein